MKTSAAILCALGEPLRIEEIDIPPLKPGQVLVEIKFSGVCHTQVSEVRGYRGADPFLPHCLGHEGSGIVRQCGPQVTKVRPGDAVILSWIKGSGMDVPGTHYSSAGRTINSGAIATFSKFSVISENRMTLIPTGLDLAEVPYIGCAVATGLGAVLNTAAPAAGQSLAVFGVGGVGLCAIAGAAITGCSTIIAVDRNPQRLAVAREMGATVLIDASQGDPLPQIAAACPKGLDFAIEASGAASVMLMSLHAVRAQGGVAVVIGNAKSGEVIPLDPKQLNMGKQLRGTWGGDTKPDRDFPRYASLMVSGALDLAPLRSRRYALSEINEALDDLEVGRVTRPLIDMSLS
jgi:S-(hydroxymethyl)glutathione dehydrogenase/alcohol dehydrogenase